MWRMGDPRHAFGLAAEDAVGAWLERCGWRIVDRRRGAPGGGEVDIVALDPAQTLVAIEVRARHSDRTGTPAATVDARRLARLSRTLAAVSAMTSTPHTGLRVDVVTVQPAGVPSDGRWILRRWPQLG
jgi:putative endonuclease